MILRRRTIVLWQLGIAISLILSILALNLYFHSTPLQTNAALRNLAPSLNHLFGTDGLGRDMFVRTIKGLYFSLQVGLLGALMGVIIATAVTHWPSLARLIRNEVYHLKNKEFVQLSKSMGKTPYYIVRHHILPLIASQIFIGFILLFPHVILHEASMTFLGFGLSAEQPSVGIILSEAAKHISLGNWWLVIFPGLYLILVVNAFDTIGESLKKLFYPQTDHF